MELHIIFFILAGLLIAILIGSSFLSNRREKSRLFSNSFSQRPPSTPINNVPSEIHSHFDTSLHSQVENVATSEVEVQSSAEIQRDVQNSLSGIKIRLPGQEENNVVRELERENATPIYGQSTFSPIYSSQLVEQNVAQYVEQVVEPAVSVTIEESISVAQESIESEPEIPADMITFYVVSAEGYQFEGEHVVQCLEALGFEYGEYNIFHRYKHLGNSNSPVIFSVANMMQPGVFNLNNLKDFSTIGLVIFMHLPTDGNLKTNLRLMLQCTERLASALNGFVLNDRHEIFDENARIEYLKRVS
ncbi:cell division protein ZipA [Haemophilus parahaemolyticus]|uniref:cell division protein ZipA n=1 Tax=Haemophilus parahaemolyticus TaxID=735 RepID=UPI0028E82E7E|nr:cell division protein ZipA [Haemophilus parahaemolyticus]